MRLLRSGLWIVVVLVASLGGCAKGRDHAAPASSGRPVASLASPLTPSSPPNKRLDQAPMRGGPTGVLFHAARNLNLNDAQRAAIDKLSQQLSADDGSPKLDFNEYQSLLIAGVRAGKLDTARLGPMRAEMEKSMEARQNKDAEALNGLHAALEPAHRKTLVTTVRQRQAERDGRMEAHKPHAAASASAKAPEADANRRRLEQITQDLGLDAAQQKKVEGILAKDPQGPSTSMETMREEMKKSMDATLTAFEADSFDARKLEVSPTPFKLMTRDSDKHVEFLTQLLPILRPEQREKLASKMQGTQRPMPGGPPHHHH